MGLTHLDAGVIIGLLDGSDAHHTSAVHVVGDALNGGHQLAIAASAIAECLVGPSRRGPDAVAAFEAAIERLPLSPRAIDLDVARSAAQLRAEHPTLKLPDALVIAAATEDGADRLITTDRGWPAEAGACPFVVIGRGAALSD